jgi:hypothetical protein
VPWGGTVAGLSNAKFPETTATPPVREDALSACPAMIEVAVGVVSMLPASSAITGVIGDVAAVAGLGPFLLD